MHDVRSVEASVSGQSSTIDFAGIQLEHPLQPYYGQHHRDSAHGSSSDSPEERGRSRQR
jgi:hypothetical protein